MIIGAHVIIASKDPTRDHEFFREVLGLDAVNAGGGYMIFGLPASEASIHASESPIPQHELYFMCSDIEEFRRKLSERDIDCTEPQDTGWGLLVRLTLPSGAPLHVYQPKHARPV